MTRLVLSAPCVMDGVGSCYIKTPRRVERREVGGKDV